jgi:hypothetical protein
MPGLDYIKGYEEGKSVEPVAETPITAVGKAVQSKSKYSLPTPTGAAGVDQGILERMQKLIDEREAQKGSFMESMRDAQAWWTGGVAGPSEALARRAKEREEQEATTFGMRRDLAQYKVGQEQARNLDKQLFGVTAPAQAQAQPGAASVTLGGTAQPGEAQLGVVAPSQTGGLLNLVRDPGLRQTIAVQAQTDRQGALKSVQSYLAKNAEDTQMIKDLRFMVDNKLIDPKLIPAALLTKFVGPSAFNPQDVRGPGGTTQTTPLGAAGAISPTASTLPGVRTAAPAAAPAPTPTAPAATAPAATAPSPATGPRPIAQVQPLPKVGAPKEAPLVPTNVQTGFTPGSKEDLDAKAAVAKQTIETGAETQKPIAKQVGESIASTKSAASNAPNNIQEYDMAESVLRRYPKAFGIGQDGSATAALIQLVKPGTTIPILGTVKSEGIEEAIAQKRLPPDALAARATFDAIATRQGVEFAKNNLTGEGRGTLSNADLKMAGVAKGLSISSPSATNLIFTILNRENEQMILDRGRLIEKFETESRAKGVQPNYNVLKESDAWKKTMSDKEERVKNRFPEFFKGGETEGTTGKLSPADFMRKK